MNFDPFQLLYSKVSFLLLLLYYIIIIIIFLTQFKW